MAALLFFFFHFPPPPQKRMCPTPFTEPVHRPDIKGKKSKTIPTPVLLV